MKAVILAGGLGSRLSETTQTVPKPMIEIGGKPILWHIMKYYNQFGIREFIICCGYRQYVIKEYFANYFRHNCDLTVDLSDNSVEIHHNNSEDWRVTMVDTGLDTMTGGRVKRIQKYVGNETFLLSYGDGVGDIDIDATIRQHKETGAVVTISAYQPIGRFGALEIHDNMVSSFIEKPLGDGNWVNAGYFVCEPKIFEFLNGGDEQVLEGTPLQKIAEQGLMSAYKHRGFWKPMDTLRDSIELNSMWNNNDAAWKIW